MSTDEVALDRGAIHSPTATPPAASWLRAGCELASSGSRGRWREVGHTAVARQLHVDLPINRYCMAVIAVARGAAKTLTVTHARPYIHITFRFLPKF